MIRSLAVFCGSKPGADDIYKTDAEELGKLMAEKNITMIYGGGRNGIMGIVADAVMENHGKVTGIIPHMLIEWEHQHESITELIIADDMHVRKKQMYDLCDAAIILPGGFGTLDELFEMVTWNALSIHDKKIILLNTAGYYNNLIAHINIMQVSGFLHSDWREMLAIYETPDAIFYDWDADKN